MKTIKGITVALALLLLSIASLAVSAQTYSIPKQLRLERAVRREFREWWITPAGYPGLIPETLFPIGWSKDGKFAYYYEPVDEACGCYFAHLVIQDMRTDKVLWEFKYNQDDTYNDKGEMTGPGTMRALWRKNQKFFNEKLREHAIVAGSSVLLGKTFILGDTYTGKAHVTIGKDQYDEDRATKLSLTLTSKRRGTKTVYSNDKTKGEYNGTLDAGLLGVIKSPFENRVALVGMEINRGWEGPPHTGDILIVGADLTSGFGK
jgi:hypothetical protein